MRFSRSAKYAILTLLRLAANGGGPLTVAELATDGQVPRAYLAKLVPQLVRAGLLASSRGRGGGVSLARPPEEIALAEVIQATDGPAFLQDCPFDPDPCPGKPHCPLAPLWDPLREKILAFLEETTLASLAARVRDEEGGGFS